MIYALLDGSEFIRDKHLESALACWEYCEGSAKLIFYGQESNPVMKKIVETLGDGPKSTTELYRAFSGKRKKHVLDRALEELIVQGKIEASRIETGGKPKTTFRFIGNEAEG